MSPRPKSNQPPTHKKLTASFLYIDTTTAEEQTTIHTMPDFDQPCIFYACFVCYGACDLGDIALGYYHHRDFLCIRSGCCLALGVDDRGVGMVTKEGKGEICKIGLYCCDLGLVKPKVLCAGFSKCLCCIDVCALPPVPGYMDDMTCAMWFIQVRLIFYSFELSTQRHGKNKPLTQG